MKKTPFFVYFLDNKFNAYEILKRNNFGENLIFGGRKFEFFDCGSALHIRDGRWNTIKTYFFLYHFGNNPAVTIAGWVGPLGIFTKFARRTGPARELWWRSQEWSFWGNVGRQNWEKLGKMWVFWSRKCLWNWKRVKHFLPGFLKAFMIFSRSRGKWNVMLAR